MTLDNKARPETPERHRPQRMVLKIAKMISTDIRSRSNAEIIRTAVNNNVTETITLDFSGVEFISRGFTDELCNIMDEQGERLNLSGMSDLVSSMIKTVSEGRKTKRARPIENAEMIECKDMESLSSFLSTF